MDPSYLVDIITFHLDELSYHDFLLRIDILHEILYNTGTDVENFKKEYEHLMEYKSNLITEEGFIYKLDNCFVCKNKSHIYGKCFFSKSHESKKHNIMNNKIIANKLIAKFITPIVKKIEQLIPNIIHKYSDILSKIVLIENDNNYSPQELLFRSYRINRRLIDLTILSLPAYLQNPLQTLNNDNLSYYKKDYVINSFLITNNVPILVYDINQLQVFEFESCSKEEDLLINIYYNYEILSKYD